MIIGLVLMLKFDYFYWIYVNKLNKNKNIFCENKIVIYFVFCIVVLILIF